MTDRDAMVAALGFAVPTRLLRCEWPPNEGVMPGSPRFDDLLASVRTEGIREPLTINLGWLVIDGHHRLAAARLLGMETVRVRVWTGSEMVPREYAALAPEVTHAEAIWGEGSFHPGYGKGVCAVDGEPWPCALAAAPRSEGVSYLLKVCTDRDCPERHYHIVAAPSETKP